MWFIWLETNRLLVTYLGIYLFFFPPPESRKPCCTLQCNVTWMRVGGYLSNVGQHRLHCIHGAGDHSAEKLQGHKVLKAELWWRWPTLSLSLTLFRLRASSMFTNVIDLFTPYWLGLIHYSSVEHGGRRCLTWPLVVVLLIYLYTSNQIRQKIYYVFVIFRLKSS